MDLLDLIDEAANLMPREKMIEINEEKITVIGDTHADTITFKVLEKEIEGKVVFLGDYGDRGDDPIGIYSRVLKMFIDGKAILLRGNHESPGVFPHELPYQLNIHFKESWRDIYEALQNLWQKMPVSALIPGEAWLAHGGVPTKKGKIDEVGISFREVSKPDDETMLEIMWNDPWERELCGENFRRGVMYFFGKRATRCLLDTLEVKVVIRSHEPQKVLRVEQDGMVVTVGTCPIPYGLTDAAMLKINLKQDFKDGFDLVRKFGYVLSVI